MLKLTSLGVVGATAASMASEFGLTAEHVNELHLIGAPKLARMVERVAQEPDVLMQELRASPLAQIAPVMGATSSAPQASAGTPIVVTHGMGDSCFNAGMKSITEAAGTHSGVYSTCVPGGSNEISDTLSGFLKTMDKNVDYFAEQVAKDANLANGFNAIGLSQGNSVIRGYIERYNNPPVLNYISVHGTVMGVSGFPNCNPSGLLGPVCDILAEVLGDLAYNEVVQGILFQANYFRDPTRTNTTQYLKNSQIAQWNNENTDNAQYTKNIESVNSFTMVKAEGDTMVFPREGEWWGEFAPGQFKEILTIEKTPLYGKFGLNTLNEAKKINFDSTKGEHLQFTVDQLEGWLDKYF